MKVEYETLSFRDAAERKASVPRWYGDWEEVLGGWDSGYGCGIWRIEDGVAVECIGTDGGEPEDQTLYRDWSWVEGALQAAYELGRKHGANDEAQKHR